MFSEAYLTSLARQSARSLLDLYGPQEVERALGLAEPDHPASQNLLDFIVSTYPQYVPEPMHMLIADHLEAVLRGEIDRLMVFAPPQHGKSQLVSVHFPAFWLAHRPDEPVILTSYGASLAYAKSWEARNLVESPAYQSLFPGVRTDESSRARDYWRIAGRRGGMVAAGVGGPITGHGAKCLPAGTLILTEIGELDIQRLAVLRYRPRVWSFDHGKPKLCRIVATRRDVRHEIIEIITVSGRSLRTTSDHRIYVEGHGFREATLLRVGDRLLAVFAFKQNLSNMRKEKTRSRPNVPILLLSSAESQSLTLLCMVWQRFRTALVRIREKFEERTTRLLLRQKLSEFTSSDKKWKSEAVPSVRCTVAEGRIGPFRTKILFGRMPQSCTTKKNPRVSLVWNDLLSTQQSYPVLFTDLRKRGTLGADAGQEQLSLQNRDELCQVVCRNAPSGFREGWLSLRRLSDGKKEENHQVVGPRSGTNEFSSASHQRGCDRQCGGKFNHSLQKMSCATPQLEYDTVALVRRLCFRSIPVYDVQVAGSRNFFANGILIHNCGIIDDPFENWEQAQSPVIREKVWQWWRGTFRTRIWEGGAVVLVTSRWHCDDLAGRLLQDQGQRWIVLRLAALAETQEERDENNARLGLVTGRPDPLGRAPGEPVCPRRFSLEALHVTRADVGSQVWHAEYQGVPRPLEGQRFRRGWFAVVDEVPAGARRVRYWDKAGTVGAGRYSVGLLMAVAGSRPDWVFYIEDVVRGRWSSGEREAVIRQTAELDAERFGHVETVVEQEPGSGGKESAEHTLANLAGFPVFADRVTGDKDLRLEPLAAQAEAGNVKLVRVPWNWEFLEEICAVPFGRYRDQADAAAGAFSRLTRAYGGGRLGHVTLRARR